jgi:hypothetical protein
MSMDPDKDMLALPAEVKLGGPKCRPRRPATATRDGCNGPTTRLTRFSSCGCSVRHRRAQAPSQNAFPTLARETVFDWLRRKLGSTERIVASVEDACDCAGA